MIQKTPSSLSAKIECHFCDIVKIRLEMIDNLNIFTIYGYLL